MKTINIAEQPWLGIGRTLRITIDGIRYRLFRAAVTVAVIAVAVAFLMNILSESLIKRAVAQNTRQRIREMRLVYDWSAKLTAPGSQETVITELAAVQPGSPRYQEMAKLGGFSEDAIARFHDNAVQAVTYITFFQDLDYAKRRNMIHTARGLGIFDRLSTPKGMEQLKTALSHIKSVRFVSSFEDLEQLIAQRESLRENAKRVLAGRKKAIAQVTANLEGKTILEALADAEGAFVKTVRDAGFMLDPQEVAPLVADQAQRLLDVLRLEKSMEEKPTRQLIAQQANVLPADVNVMMMWKYLDGKRFARKYLAKMEESDLDTAGLNPERIVMLAGQRKETTSLVRAERLTMDAGKGFMGLGERLAWLLFVSLLVCGIGICNAMLMTVTERFTEIATLKCLGALDGFIMIMFVLESCFLGVVGGTIGALAGALIGLGRMLVAFGIDFLGAIPAFDMLAGILVSIAMGVILAAVAAVLPSLKAAKLAPMEAMRIE